MDPYIPFSGAKLKVSRARKHIAELQRVIDEFSATEFYEIVMKLDDLERWMPVVFPFKPIPDELPLIIGDAVHNLRSALEHLVYALVPSRETAFPMHMTQKNFETDKSKLNLIEDALPGAKDLLLKKVQPYTGGNGELLYALHSLDKSDKHHKILLTTTAALGGSFRIIENGDVRVAISGIRFDPNQNTVIPLIGPWTAETELQHDNRAMLEVSFGEPAILSKKAVIPTLLKMAQNVDQTIVDFCELANL